MNNTNTNKDLAPAPAQTNAAPAKRVSVLGTLAAQLNCDPATLLGVLKKSVFAACKTDEEFQMACMTAAKYGLDPVQKEIYAFPAKSGAVVPVVGVDGWVKIMNSHPCSRYGTSDRKCTTPAPPSSTARIARIPSRSRSGWASATARPTRGSAGPAGCSATRR